MMKGKHCYEMGKELKMSMRMLTCSGLALLLVISGAACTQPAPVSATSLPTATNMVLPASPTPSLTPVPTATETAVPLYSIFGRWLPNPDTVTAPVSNPPPGQFCYPNAYWNPIPEIIITATDDPAVVIVEGLHEHIRTQELVLDVENQRIEDRLEMPEINQTLLLVLELQPDGRLYYEETFLLGGTVYCTITLFYSVPGE